MALAFWWLTVGLVSLILAAGLLGALRRRARAGTPLRVAYTWLRVSDDLRRRSLERSGWRIVFAVIAVTALAVVGAVTAGRWIYQRVEVPEKANRDIVLCLDVSGSMIRYDRIVIQRYLEMLPGFQGERISLVLWNSSAVPVFPLTDDYEFVAKQMNDIEESLQRTKPGQNPLLEGTTNGRGASLIGDGLASCALMFGERVAAGDSPAGTAAPGASPAPNPSPAGDQRSRSIIFASDNAVNGTQIVSLPEAARVAQERRITVYGLDANREDDAYAEEFRLSMEQHGGLYFRLSDPSSVAGIVERITSDQTAVLRGAPTLVVVDRPAGWLIALLCVLPIALGTLRRARL